MKKLFFAFLFLVSVLFCITVTASAEEWFWPTPVSRMNTTWITQKYKSSHLAIDIGGSHGSDPIYASKSGTVVARFDGCTCRSEGRGGCSDNNRELGNFVIIDHGNGEYSRYCHLYYKDVAKLNSYVKQGDIIGYMGSTGSSTGVHLDFRIYQDGTGIQTYSNGYGAYEQKVIGGTTLNNNPKNVYSDGNIMYITTPNPGFTDTEAPTISGLNVKDISGESFTVECNLNDNVGVTRVWFVIYAPGGTYEFGDSASNGYYSKTLYTKDYGGTGVYDVRMYAFDAQENGVLGSFGCFDSSPYPSAPWISVDKYNFATNCDVTFTYHANDATMYSLWLFKDGICLGETTLPSNGIYTTKFDAAGYYQAYVSCSNSKGYIDSGKIEFNVYSDVPPDPWIYTEQKSVQVGESITAVYNASNASYFALGFDRYGERVHSVRREWYETTYTISFDTPGTYTVYVSAYNDYGYADSRKVIFTVHDKTVCNLGESFYGKILNKDCWKPVKNDNCVLKLTDEKGYASEMWKFVRLDDGSYEIFSCSTGENLIAGTGDYDTTSSVVIGNTTEINRKQWFIYNYGNGIIMKPKSSEFVLELENESTETGTAVLLNELSGYQSQIFNIYQGSDIQLVAPTLSITCDSNYGYTYLNWNGISGTDKYKIKIYNSATNELCYMDDVNADTKKYNIRLSPGNYKGEVIAYNYFVGESSGTVEFELCDVIHCLLDIDNEKYIFNVTLKLDNPIDSQVLLVLYDNEGSILECITKDYADTVAFETEIYTSIEFAKVMVWNSLSDLSSLCEAEVIPQSEFITE